MSRRSVSNIVPSAMFNTFHIFNEPGLLARVRNVLDQRRRSESSSGFDIGKLVKDPLLSSIYAETLRVYVKTYFVASSPHEDVLLGKWWLPKGKVALVNSGISHMDEGFWNTKAGTYPVNKFWPDRFITYAHDPSSGPTKPGTGQPKRREMTGADRPKTSEGSFDLDGLEGSWIPYGGQYPPTHPKSTSNNLSGGHAICPGRFLAKTAIILSGALIADRYDIELLAPLPPMSSAKFGLGTQKPGDAMPFRVCRRAHKVARAGRV